jgi:hypothetical protein
LIGGSFVDGLRKMRSKIVEIEASLGENLIEIVFSLQTVKFNSEKIAELYFT